MICQQCGKRNDPDAVFCVQCSQPLLKSCPSCSTQNLGDARFCKKCRTELDDTSIATEANKLQDLRDSAPKDLQEKLRLAKTEIEGQRKPVTILFADIVGSTSIAEKLDPEEWKEVVQGAHHRVSEAIHRYEGTIAQLLRSIATRALSPNYSVTVCWLFSAPLLPMRTILNALCAQP